MHKSYLSSAILHLVGRASHIFFKLSHNLHYRFIAPGQILAGVARRRRRRNCAPAFLSGALPREGTGRRGLKQEISSNAKQKVTSARLIVWSGAAMVRGLLKCSLSGRVLVLWKSSQPNASNPRVLPREGSGSIQNDQSVEGITPLHFDWCGVGAKIAAAVNPVVTSNRNQRLVVTLRRRDLSKVA